MSTVQQKLQENINLLNKVQRGMIIATMDQKRYTLAKMASSLKIKQSVLLETLVKIYRLRAQDRGFLCYFAIFCEPMSFSWGVQYRLPEWLDNLIASPSVRHFISDQAAKLTSTVTPHVTYEDYRQEYKEILENTYPDLRQRLTKAYQQLTLVVDNAVKTSGLDNSEFSEYIPVMANFYNSQSHLSFLTKNEYRFKLRSEQFYGVAYYGVANIDEIVTYDKQVKFTHGIGDDEWLAKLNHFIRLMGEAEIGLDKCIRAMNSRGESQALVFTMAGDLGIRLRVYFKDAAVALKIA